MLRTSVRLAALRRGLRCIAVLALVGAASGARSEEPIVLRFSHFLGPQSEYTVDVVGPWGRELEARTGGRAKVEILDGTTPFGRIFDQASNVKAGKVDIALGLRGAEGDKFLGSSIIELPFLSPSSLRGSRALWSLYTDGTLADEYRDYKVLALHVHNPGLVHTMDRRVVMPADVKGLRFRSPNRAVSEALNLLGATPIVLQVNEVVPAIEGGRIDGIVTNWGNPLPNFNAYVKHHLDIGFYSAAFFVVMNKERYASLPADVREAIDATTGDVWVDKFASYWDKWDKPVRDGAQAPGHEIIVPDAATVAEWRAALKPAGDLYLDKLASGGFPAAQAVYDKLSTALR